MCDCFHVVLPTWPGAPGSGAPPPCLQPAPLGAGGLRMGAGCPSGGPGARSLPEDTPSRQVSSGRRRSWWKRDSGDSRTFSRMSRPEVGTVGDEGQGASGYSVTGGGDQGIFVKQVLKDSSAAKLFNLREGDQLLSTTIFFDDIKYEDALKILQYSEPYKVQFKIRRKLPAREDEAWASSSAQRGPQGSEKQAKDVGDGSTETPTKTLEGDGDQERLISKPREGRGRRPQKERLSWPKFQTIKSKRTPGPRRSHSSSEAYERGDVPDVSPTSTDTEAQLPAEEQEQKAGPGGQRRRRFLNLKFRMGSGRGLAPVGRPGRGVQGGAVQAGVLEEPTQPGHPRVGAVGEGAALVPGRATMTKEAKVQEEPVPQEGADQGPAPGVSGEGQREGVQGLEIGIARLSLKDTADEDSTRKREPEFQIRIPTLKTPKFGFSKEKGLGTEESKTAPQRGLMEEGAGQTDTEGAREGPESVPEQEKRRAEEDVSGHKGDAKMVEKAGEGKMKMLKFKRPSFGWSPVKHPRTVGGKPTKEREKEIGGSITFVKLDIEIKDTDAIGEDTETHPPEITGEREEKMRMEGEDTLREKDVVVRDSKFRMPKFKMPSFGVSAPSKSVEASLDASLPKVQADVSLPSIQADVKTADLSVELPSAELEVKTAGAGVKLPEGPGPEGEPQEPAAGAGLKGHLPKVQMPSIKMPKVDFKAPQVDIKGPKLDVKGAKGEVTAPGVEVSLPSVEVDAQVPGAKLEGDASLGDKEVAARDSKLKMPKFKMPSFGVSAAGKDLGTSVDVPAPKVGGEATLPSVGAELTAPEGSVPVPSAEVRLPGGELEVALPEGEAAGAELKGKAEGARIKAHLPKVQMPSIKMPKVDIRAPQVDIKGPSADLKGLKGEATAPGVEVSLPSVEVDAQVPGAKLEGDASLGDKEVAARDSKFKIWRATRPWGTRRWPARDSKLKMPKFKMPSFGVSAAGKDLGTSVDVPAPKVGGEATLPSVGAELTAPEGSVPVPSAEVRLPGGELGVALPEGEAAGAELKGKAEGARIKAHLPKVQMPSIKMPKVDIRAPQVDIKGPSADLKGLKGEATAPGVEVSLPSVEVDAQVPGAKLEGDASLGDKEVAARDSKFKMPKFKMPSFGVSAPSKSVEASLDASLPKVQADVSLPSIQADVKTADLSVELPSAELEVKTAGAGVKLPEGPGPEGEPQEPAAGAGLKGHLPKVQMPSIKMPKVDFKAPQVDIKGPKLDVKGAKGEVTAPGVEVSLPSVEVDAQVPGAKLEGDASLGDKEVAARDSKFKMPKFKMPSFGVSAPSKSVEASLDASLPKVQADVSLPSIQADVKTADLSVELPSAELEVKTAGAGVKLPEGPGPEGEPQEPAAGAGLKGHLPKVQMPSIKMPKVDFKAPQVDIKGPKLDVKGAKGEVTAPGVEVSLPSVEVDAQVPGAKLEGDASLGDKEVAARDSKLKMPKFKMPSFGVSAAGKDLGTSVDVPAPKVGGEATLPSVGAELTAPEGSVPVPSAEVRLPGGELGVALPEGEAAGAELKGKAEGARIKAHLPKVQMPSIKMPKVDIRAPQVDIKGPSADLKGLKGEATAPGVEVSLPSVEVDAQVPGAKLEGDASLGDKEVAAARDSKFKMPKFKMPSFGVSAPSKSVEASLDASLPKVQADVSLPSIQADVKTADLSVELPSAELEVKTAGAGVKLPEGPGPEGEPQEPAAGAGLKGHLPKVQMPSIKMPKVDFKAPQVDIKGPKLDVKGAKGEVTAPGVEVSLPSVEVDAQVPGAKLEGDASLGDKEVAARDSKLKMPKFKMPSFGVSAAGKDLGTSVDVPAPKVGGEATLPSVGAELTAPEGSVPVPSAEVRLPGGELGVALPEGEAAGAELKGKAEGARIKAHLPKVQMPSIKMPQVDIRAPQVDIKGPSADLKGLKGEATAPGVEVSLPSVEVDAQVPGAKLEGDASLGDKEVAARDSKFKMPKFKMPSFGVSAPSKSVEASLDASLPKVQADVSLPSIQADVKTADLSVELPSAELEVKTAGAGVKLPEGPGPEGEPQEPAAGAGLKGHLPKVQMPSIKMPKVDFKAPQVDIKGPKLDVKGAKGEVTAPGVEVSLPSVEVDAQVPGAKLEGDASLGDKEVAARDSKFKMPKFKMPSFGVSAPSKSVEASLDASLPKVQADVSLPSIQADVKTADLSVELPSAELEVKTAGAGVKLPEGPGPEGEPQEPAAGAGLKGHLPKVQMPSIKMPKVDFKAPQVDIKGPKLDVKGAKGEVTAPGVEVSLPSVEVDAQVPGAKLEGDASLGDKEVAARDSKLKMPKFKMPSFGVSAAGKDLGTSVDVPAPKVGGEATLPSVGAELTAPEGSVPVPSAEVRLPGGELGVALPEGEAAGAELKGKAEGARIKAHLPKVQMPSIKMPQVDIRAPQVDIKGPSADLKGLKGEATAPGVEVSLPSVEVDAQVPGAKLEGDASLGDKEVAARDSKFKMPKFKMPSFGVSAPSKSVEASLDASLPKVQADVSLPSIQADVKTADLSVELPSAELEVKTAGAGVKLPEGPGPEGEPQEPAAGAGLKGHLPKVQMPSIKMPKVDFKAPQVDIKGPKLDVKGAKGEVTAPGVEVSLPSVEVDAQVPGAKLEGDASLGDKEVAARDSKLKMPKFKMPSFGVSAAGKDLGTDMFPEVCAGDPSVSGVGFDGSVSVEKCAEKVKSRKSHFKFPKLFSPPERAPGDSLALDTDSAHPLPPSVSVPASEVPGSRSSLQRSRLGWAAFPSAKLELSGPQAEVPTLTECEGVTLTKYQVTVPRAAVPLDVPQEALSGSQVGAHLPSMESSADFPSPERVSLSPTHGHPGPVDPLFPASYGQVTFPIFHRPKFGFSVPKAADAEVEPRGVECAPTLSPLSPTPGLDSSAAEAAVFPLPGTHLPSLEVSVSQGPEGPQDTVETSAMAPGRAPAEEADCEGKSSPLKMPRLKLPSLRWSPKKGAEPKEDPGRSLEDEELSVVVDVGPTGVPPEVPVPGMEAHRDMPPEEDGEEKRAKTPGFGNLKLALPRMKTSKAGADLPQGRPDPSLSSPPGGVGGTSVMVGLPTEAPPQPSCRAPDAEASTAGSPQGDAAAGEVPATSQESWFRMPALHLPSFLRSSKDRGGAGGPGAQMPVPAASTSREGEAPATVKSQGAPVSWSEVEAPTSLQSPEGGADSAAAESAPHTDVLRCSLDSRGLKLDLPADSVSTGMTPLPGPAGPAGAGEGAGERSSHPEGPLRLKASSTDVPSQISVVTMGQLWEDSVQTVRFPKLEVPRFCFPAPSSEADVFVPTVREVQCSESSLDFALSTESPGDWGASILKTGAGVPGEQPVALDLSSEAPPISKVRVHIQGTEVESQEVTIHSRVTAEFAHLLGPEAISTQIVRESDIPASQIRTPSYGFSLLKAKIPEPPTQAGLHMVTRDSRLSEDLREAPRQVTPGADPISGDLQPDTGEPFEIISPGVSVPELQMCAFDVRPGHQFADSCSDEEPAEILEFPPEDSQEAPLADEDGAPKEKPESKRSAGLFRFWLPNIGFSSSVDETSAEPKDDVPKSAPIQTQPEAQPEAGPPKKQEKAGWFRFPKLGFSSTPTKKSKTPKDEAGPAEQNLQEEAVTFFDARETFSPEEKDGEPAEASGAGPGSGAMVASAARTELILLEQDREASEEPAPGPATE
uniref:PDZ domain-containing protein n=1 Tax=Equus asinus TaxID=9793 RepID=A0A9L0KK25_EQUAS